jgi:hypothetical protein
MINMPRLFRLTKKISLDIIRSTGKGTYSDTTGLPIPASTIVVPTDVNIHPYTFAETRQLEASERTKEWIHVFSESELRKEKEGAGGWDADRFTYLGKKYKVMRVESYHMGILDHYHAEAALDSPTPRSG